MFLIPIAIVLSPWSSLFPINYLCLYSYSALSFYLPRLRIWLMLSWAFSYVVSRYRNFFSRSLMSPSELFFSSSRRFWISESSSNTNLYSCIAPVSFRSAYPHLTAGGAISARTFSQRLRKPWLAEAAYRAPGMSTGVIGCRDAFRPFATLRFGVAAGRRLLLLRSLASTARSCWLVVCFFLFFLSMIITLFGENVKPFGGLHWASTLLRLVGEAVWWIDGVTAGRDVVVLQACVVPLLCHSWWAVCLM